MDNSFKLNNDNSSENNAVTVTIGPNEDDCISFTQKLDFKVTDDGIYMFKPYRGSTVCCSEELVMTKEVFIEAYNKYIKGDD